MNYKVTAEVSLGIEQSDEDSAEEEASEYLSTRLGTDSVLNYEDIVDVEREE